MPRRNDFQDLVGAGFALVVLFMMLGILKDSFGDLIGLGNFLPFLFVIGILLIVVALIAKIIKFFDDVFF